MFYMLSCLFTWIKQPYSNANLRLPFYSMDIVFNKTTLLEIILKVLDQFSFFCFTRV